jgi:hypothetical protein
MADTVKCPVCGLWNPADTIRCDCGHAFVSTANMPDFDRKTLEVKPGKRNVSESIPTQQKQAFPFLGFGGVFFLAVGMYFLVINPSASFPLPLNTSQPPATSGTPITSPSNVVNLQRLSIGETFTICGVILIAAEWRPRG